MDNCEPDDPRFLILLQQFTRSIEFPITACEDDHASDPGEKETPGGSSLRQDGRRSSRRTRETHLQSSAHRRSPSSANLRLRVQCREIAYANPSTATGTGRRGNFPTQRRKCVPVYRCSRGGADKSYGAAESLPITRSRPAPNRAIGAPQKLVVSISSSR